MSGSAGAARSASQSVMCPITAVAGMSASQYSYNPLHTSTELYCSRCMHASAAPEQCAHSVKERSGRIHGHTVRPIPAPRHMQPRKSSTLARLESERGATRKYTQAKV